MLYKRGTKSKFDKVPIYSWKLDGLDALLVAEVERFASIWIYGFSMASAQLWCWANVAKEAIASSGEWLHWLKELPTPIRTQADHIWHLQSSTLCFKKDLIASHFVWFVVRLVSDQKLHQCIKSTNCHPCQVCARHFDFDLKSKRRATDPCLLLDHLHCIRQTWLDGGAVVSTNTCAWRKQVLRSSTALTTNKSIQIVILCLVLVRQGPCLKTYNKQSVP